MALLRAEGVHAGFCYQKLGVLHGLVAVRVPGNTSSVNAEFRTVREQLAHDVRPFRGECDYAVLYAEPHPLVLRSLHGARDQEHLWELLDTAL